MIESLTSLARETSLINGKFIGALDDEDAQRGEVDKATKFIENTKHFFFS